MPQKGLPLRTFAIFLLAAVIGVAGGVLGSFFQRGLNLLQEWLTGGSGAGMSEAVRENLSWWQALLVPTIGGLAAGSVLMLLRGKRPPFGIADLVGLVQLRKGVLRIRQSIVQIISSACTIGTGGSIGREGANSQIAATVASMIANVTRLSSKHRAVLIGCGVAAGMATSYNAPIAGAIFVMEIVLGNFAMDVFAPIVVASVLATIVRSELLTEARVYQNVSDVVERLPLGLVLAALVLGLFCGVGGVLFRSALKGGRRAFASLRLPLPLVMATGGLIVGAVGTFMPESWGNGFEIIDDVVANAVSTAPSLALIVTLFLWKQIATVATVGSGGLGGIFTPNLVIGAAFGVLFASAVGTVFDVAPGEVAAFAFVGMAGLTAATMHAPVTAVVLVFELTGHYELTLPVMLCSIVASVTASVLDEDNYYTAAMKAKGEDVPGGLEDLAIRTTYVRDVVRDDCLTVPHSADFTDVMKLLQTHRGDTVYVIGDHQALIGRIELQDVKSFLNDPTLTTVVIAADMTRPVVTATADMSIAEVMPRFDDPELREIAAVTGHQPPRLLGRIRHQDVLTMLGNEVLGQQRRSLRLAVRGRREELDLPAGYAMRSLTAPAAWDGLAVDALPPASRADVVVVLLIRAGSGREEVLAATANRTVAAGDELVVLGTRAAVRELRELADDV
ncbi:MAG: chloride channel protein [Planctomycetota bacterium]|nr:chloride channel protein [Planctomycetota bacterium]